MDKVSGFDPSKFVKREAARPDAPQSVAAPSPEAERSLQQSAMQKVDEHQPFKRKRGKTVAGVATVAALDHDKPFFRELNAMFEQRIPPVFKGGRWRELCEDIRHFVDSGKAAKALDAGWLPIELFGSHARPWEVNRWPVLGTQSVVSLMRGRAVGYVGPAKIELLNPGGKHAHIYRAHMLSDPSRIALMWDVFDPKHWPNIGTELRWMT